MFTFTRTNDHKLTVLPLGPFVLAETVDKDFIVQACHATEFSVNTAAAVSTTWGVVKNIGGVWSVPSGSQISCGDTTCDFPDGSKVGMSHGRIWISLPHQYCGELQGLCGRYSPEIDYSDAFSGPALLDGSPGTNYRYRGEHWKTSFALSYAATAASSLFTSDECPIVPYNNSVSEPVPFEDCPELEAEARRLCPLGPFYDDCIHDIGITCNLTQWIEDYQQTEPPAMFPT